MPVTTEISKDNRSWPIYPVFELGKVAGLGHAHYSFDTDGVVRGLNLEEGGLTAFALATLLADKNWPRPTSDQGPIGQALALATEKRRQEMFETATWSESNFVLLPGVRLNREPIPYAQVLRSPDLEHRFKNKFVFIGATAAGLHDSYANSAVVNEVVSRE